ncbi:T9SS type A sorting domain-containing protein [Tamlana fucoidanivorans]|uniref:T9SS type A sorting domain-containing protein n=1 Tax=Allotamlana fucoidanivorans TaxID=2583814 RepID=A0A5C4SJ06_9FLAO|nr:T9SS type A sorting domain-containing protein [Tamlana fucoidanivorans]TNJ43485.1 T9SS type A sorting domain-containing protein [Tamlana fucoidanivorans]
MGVIYHDLGNHKLACKHLQKAKSLHYEDYKDANNLDIYIKGSCDNEPVEIEENNTYAKLLKAPYISPNPTKEQFSVKNLPFEVFNYTIHDMFSKKVLQGQTTDNTINISRLPSRVYYVHIVQDELNQKLLLIKE